MPDNPVALVVVTYVNENSYLSNTCRINVSAAGLMCVSRARRAFIVAGNGQGLISGNK